MDRATSNTEPMAMSTALEALADSASRTVAPAAPRSASTYARCVRGVVATALAVLAMAVLGALLWWGAKVLLQ